MSKSKSSSLVQGACIAALLVGGGLAASYGTSPPLLVGMLIPAVLLLSSHLRRAPIVAAWILAVVPMALVLWQATEQRNGPTVLMLLIGAAGMVGYLFLSRGSKIAGTLALLGGLVLLVAFFSGGRGSAGTMVSWLLSHGATEDQAHLVTQMFRKTVHFVCYGTTGWAAWRTLREAGSGPNAAVLIGFLTAVSLASFDELRQAGYASRTGSPWDVLLDASGAATFIGLSEWRRSKGG